LIVDTRRLFCRLLRTFEIDTVCDVGSMDGSDALRFRRVLPNAAIVALEPNPRNFALMQADERLHRRSIRILPLAASDRNSEAPFFVVDAEYEAPLFVLDARVAKGNLARRGMSSLHRRADSTLIADVVQVRMTRLDDLLASSAGARIALWIDTEGMAYEAVSGASGVLPRTQMLHVEAETIPCIGAEQRLFPDVERFLIEAGFSLLATDQPISSMQLNALFVRAELLATRAAEIRWHVASERLRRRVKSAVRPLLPLRLRRYLAARHANAVHTV
jgi:FkbM family methyltransferase